MQIRKFMSYVAALSHFHGWHTHTEVLKFIWEQWQSAYKHLYMYVCVYAESINSPTIPENEKPIDNAILT